MELMQDMSLQTDEESDTSESDSEDNDSVKKNKKNKKPKEALRINSRKKTTSKPSFWKDMFKNVYQSTRLLKSIEGRAAKVHSFMRGLSMSTCYPFSPFSDASSPGFDDLDASYSGASKGHNAILYCHIQISNLDFCIFFWKITGIQIHKKREKFLGFFFSNFDLVL